MKQLKPFYLLNLSILALGACSDDKDDPQPVENNIVEVVVEEVVVEENDLLKEGYAQEVLDEIIHYEGLADTAYQGSREAAQVNVKNSQQAYRSLLTFSRPLLPRIPTSDILRELSSSNTEDEFSLTLACDGGGTKQINGRKGADDLGEATVTFNDCKETRVQQSEGYDYIEMTSNGQVKTYFQTYNQFRRNFVFFYDNLTWVTPNQQQFSYVGVFQMADKEFIDEAAETAASRHVTYKANGREIKINYRNESLYTADAPSASISLEYMDSEAGMLTFNSEDLDALPPMTNSGVINIQGVETGKLEYREVGSHGLQMTLIVDSDGNGDFDKGMPTNGSRHFAELTYFEDSLLPIDEMDAPPTTGHHLDYYESYSISDDINIDINISDYGDLEGSISEFSVNWYINGVLALERDRNGTLPVGSVTINDQLEVTQVVVDSKGYLTESDRVTLRLKQ